MTSAPDPLPRAPEIDDSPPAPVRPREVLISFWAWIAAAALEVVLIPLVLADRHLLTDEALDEERAGAVLRGDTLLLDAGMVRFGAGIVIGVVCVVVLALAAAYVWFALRMLAGRGWARAVLIGLTAISAVSAFWVDTDWYGMSMVGLSVFATVLMVMPTANAYFENSRFRGQF
ncbi:hypothetical protein NLX83_07000 [Allokutzneria sp. A3M-2-11 16]|uniref:hypothetical protein n=1 Tax=Allokutzneria sp. A3M-2-11 16 TaxID=2962043 RepID=UPI0020B74449|nr:hypothetical protein [Allokutzneria sp. A3M-2-11 16]MCP3799000.1 hypothetical protein [Allokutzneria sp. A3M-2-11 16]